MAKPRWLARAQNLSHIRSYEPKNFGDGDGIRFTIGKKYLEVFYDASSSDTLIEQIVSAWNASDTEEIAEITASVDTDNDAVLVLTHDTPGVDFEITVSVTNATDSSNVITTTQGSPVVNEVQKLELLGTPSGGTFTITYDFGSGNETTAAIAYNASAATIKSAIEALTSVTAGDLSVTGSGPWYITWGGTFAGTEVPEGTVDGSSLTGTATVDVTTITNGQGLSNEIQILSMEIPASGSWTLLFGFGGSQASFSEADTINAALIKTRFEALASIGSGNVEVYGGRVNNDTVNLGYNFAIVFVGDLAGANVSQISVDLQDSAFAVAATVSAGGQSSTNEIQMINLGGPGGGTWDLTFGSETIEGLSYDIDSASLDAQIELFSGIDTVSVNAWRSLVSGPGEIAGGIYIIEHTGADADTNMSAFEINTGGITGAVESSGVTEVRQGEANADEIQHIVVGGTGGTFTLSDGTDTTSAISQGAAASTIKTRLETDITAITTVSVTGTGTAADPYVVTFTSPAATNMSELTGDASSLTGGAGQITEYTSHDPGTDEVQKITLDAGVSGGQFRLTFSGETTAWIDYDAVAADVETALEALSGIAGVTVTGSAGGPWTVTFDVSPLSSTDVPAITIDRSRLVISAGDEDVTDTLVQHATGVEWWNNADNWSTDQVPEQDDEVSIDHGTVSPRRGIRQRGTFTADASTDYVTFSGVDFVEDQKINLLTTDTLPGGLSTGTDYFILNYDHETQTAQLSLTRGGSAVNITDAGTGTHTAVVELSSIDAPASFEGEVGLPEINVDGNYYEYRPQELLIGVSSSIYIGQGSGGGTPGFRINLGTTTLPLLSIRATGQPQGSEKAVTVKGSSITEIEISKGSLAIAPKSGDSGTVATLRQGYQGTIETDTDVFVGPDASIGAVVKTGGAAEILAPITTSMRQSGGEADFNGDSALAQLYVQGGDFRYNSTGTLGGNAVVSGDGHLDFSQDLRTKTVTNPIDRYGSDSRVSDPHQVVTNLRIDNNETEDLENLNIGRNVRVTRGAVA